MGADLKKISGPYYELTMEIKNRIEKLSYVDAFWIHGSRAVGRGTADSDIDYTILVKDAKEQEPRLKELFDDLLEWDEVPGFYPEQMWPVASWKKTKESFSEVSLRVATTSKFTRMFDELYSLERVKHRGERWLEPYQDTKFLRLQGAAQFLIMESVPVYDPDGHLEKLKEKISEYPDDISRQVVREFIEKLKVKLMWLTDDWIPRNKYTFVSDIRDILYYIAIAHYALNKRFMQNGLKRYDNDLAELKPDIRAEMGRLLAIDDRFAEENKSPYLRRIIEKIEGKMQVVEPRSSVE